MATLDQEILYLDAQDKPKTVSLRTMLTLIGEDMAVFRKENGFAQDFRGVSYESILDRMLARVTNEIDKRQGSIIYDTLAPVAVELAQALFEMQCAIQLSYASRSVGKWLDMRVAEHGVLRIPANTFEGLAICWADEEQTQPYTNGLGLLVGSVVQIPDAMYPDGSVVSFVVEEYRENGIFKITATQPGSAPNGFADGTELFPLQYVSGVRAVTLNGVLTPGRDEESDEELFDRFVDYITNPPFGGNRADYRDRLRHIEGMGGNKLYRADPEKGYVRIVILGSDGLPPTAQFVEKVQQIIDPEGGDGTGKGQGIGEAPMCHYVTIEGAEALLVNINMKVQLNAGLSLGQVQREIEEQIEAYFAALREEWDTLIAPGDYRYIDTVVRTALIDAQVVTHVQGIKDVQDTKINGQATNITIPADCVPVLGIVTLTQV